MKNIKKYTTIFVIFMIIIIILFLISALIFTTARKNKSDFKSFEENINKVLEKINNIYITKQEYIGIKLNSLDNIDKYKKKIDDINKIYNLNILSEEYYFLDETSKKELGIAELEDEYIVSYNEGKVFNLNPIRHNGKIYYTSQVLDNNITSNREYAYNIPVIPEGFRYVTGNWDTGFTIIDNYENEFVWVPVGYLNKDNPVNAFKKYYKKSNTKQETEEYKNITSSIKKYGGFYIARYEASLQGATAYSSKGISNILQVKKDIMPVANMSYSTNENEYKYAAQNSDSELVNLLAYNYELYGYTSAGVLAGNKSMENVEQESQTDTKQEIKGALEMARSMPNDYNWSQDIHATLIYAEQLDTLLKIIENLRFIK